MKQNDFYEVNGCTEFIPITINEEYADGVGVTVHSTTHPFKMTVKQVYQFQKPHKPQKVVVPKFVAEWIEETKEHHPNLRWVWDVYPNDLELNKWLKTNTETFMLAWLDGYEVEKEQLYTVKVVGTGQYLVERYKKQGYVFIDTEDPLLFTKSELEAAGFRGVFDNPMFEVEEVE
ncbi:TPA: DUF1642 domain-containing protein [Streptococcus suis]|nr:DUF1642 domain-containing protein [Streptococcus suis]